jgi:glycosyltransferase involved in cell wall biosynthesis
MISVVMPSYLGDYGSAATDRPTKLRRAIESFLSQGIGELVIVPDGCQQTFEISSEYPVLCLDPIPKCIPFSGQPRNVGIDAAQYDYIAYLDSDDIFGENHLCSIVEHLDAEWLWWDDYADLNKRSVILERGRIGTSCIAHKKSLNVVWPDGYAHDWGVVEQLMRHQNKKIETHYQVMHIPGVMDK